MKTRVLLLLTAIIFSLMPAAGQTVDALKKERKEIEERLKETEQLLKKTQKEEKSTLSRVNIISRTLSDRKRLIDNFNEEIRLLEESLTRLEAEKKEMERQLELQKGEYGKMVRKMQTNRNAYSSLMFVLSAKTFDQSVRRARYLAQFTDYRKTQVRKIEGLQRGIQEKADSLERHKQEKLEALKAKEVEAAKLQADEKRERSLLAGLKKEERRLLTNFKAQEKKKADIDRKIQRIIEEEIRKQEEIRRLAEARRKAEEEARRKAAAEAQRKADEKRLAEQKSKQKPTKTEVTKPVGERKEVAVVTPKASPSVDVMAKEEKLLSGNFASNKGRLPWPVDRGVISGKFGKQPHPELKYVEINNKGTYFRSPVGTNSRAVYDGVVNKVFSLPGSGSAVIIQHGSYRSVYANLSAVYVREGQKVSAKQTIGKIHTDDSSGQAEMLFQIYLDRNLMNPEAWIAR